MTKHQLLPIILALLSMFLLLGACSDKPADPFASSSMVSQLEDPKTLLYKNRSASNKKKKLPSFELLYEGNLETLLVDNGTIDLLIQQYQLSVVHSFEIDANYKGITLQALAPLIDPITVGKDLSLADQVLMIEISNTEEDIKEELL
ncbi:MAG: hypothetical protein ACRBFS_25600 [Aureispira sp.]